MRPTAAATGALRTVLLLMLCLLCGSALASGPTPTQLADTPLPRQQLSGPLWWLNSPTPLDAEQALRRLQDGYGRILDATFPALGFRSNTQWFLLQLEQTGAQHEWVLQLGRPYLDHVRLYRVEQDQPILLHTLGGAEPFHERPLADRSLSVPLTLAPGQHSFLLAVKTDTAIDLPIRLLTQSEFARQQSRDGLRLGLFYGAMLIMVLFNLFLFMSSGDRSYLYYVAHLASVGLNLLTRDGLAYQYLWPDAPHWNHYSLVLLNAVAVSSSILFTSHFLGLSKDRPAIHRHVLLAAGLVLMVSFAAPLDYSLALRLSALVVVIWVLAANILAIREWRLGQRSAGYFFSAFFVLGLCSTLYVLKGFGVLPVSTWLESAMQFGLALQALLLSFALADRMNTLTLRSNRAQQAANSELEERVRERTQALNTALDARNQFLAVMGHEIRTPLNGIIGTLDLLRDTPLTSDQARHLGIIEQSGHNLLTLIDDVLDYSRLEAGKMPIQSATVDLATLTEECVQLFQSRAARDGNRISHYLAPSALQPVLGDPLRLRQVLVNLLSNAVKFTDHGEIWVRWYRDERRPEFMVCEVEDTGIGIPREQLTELFEQFRQVDGSSSRRHGGTGLGLAICRQIVEAMGGDISVDSIPQRGSCFTFRVPLPISQAINPVADDERPAGVRSARLLVVDDNPINLMVAEGLCRKLGHEVESADSGMAAIDRLMSSRWPFEVILLDCEMPGLDGYATARRIIGLQQQGLVAPAPIIALSAHALPEKVAACFDAGMVGHIDKPVTLAKLEQGLRAVLAPPRALAATAQSNSRSN
ncbi:7TM diverse intracellular signaling domain-containing protein [Isoalcanivorax beigongshangi]|uniref:histidine kinase n=1 Tax=Isoalcanivorax beigongshangi TaxID=3238810 RepID=A0ABV4AKF9_9GAMM